MRPKLAVIGSTNWDMSMTLPRLPSPKETITGGVCQFSLGGKGANQAVAAAQAGAEVAFLSAVGDDAIADQVRSVLTANGVAIDHLLTLPATETGKAMIFVDQQGENCIGVADGANGRLMPEALTQFKPVLSQCSYTLLQLEVPIATVLAAARMAKQQGSKVILNPAPMAPLPDELLAQCDLITPNEVEMCQLCQQAIANRSDLERAAKTLLAKGPGTIVVTLGGDGVFIATSTTTQHLPAFSVPVVDTTAAGDVFNGALAVALASGASVLEAAEFANAAAALSVGKPGAINSIPAAAEIQAFLARVAGHP